jgi:uncharacterized protein (DUF433 family)
MSTAIRVWEIRGDGLVALDSSMASGGRNEADDLQRWIRTDPGLLGGDLVIVGEQVATRSGPLDFLALDSSGNTVVVELKRDRLPREALAQAIDYASDVAQWEYERLNEECLKYHKQTLDAYLNENLPEADVADLSINEATRVLLVGTAAEEALERMVEWLSGTFGMGINVVLFRYVKTQDGAELLARTVVIPEQVERERSQRQAGRIPMSDDPGAYEPGELRGRLAGYLAENRPTPRRIARFLLPLCVEHEPVTRDRIKQALVDDGEAQDERQAGLIICTLSRELGMRDRDYLRQVIRYEKTSAWEKDNYRIEAAYRDMVRELLGATTETRGGSAPSP